MENASQALIIAGAILLAILIIAIGMYIYNSASSNITDSISQLNDSEIQAFNSKFEPYKGQQSGSQVSALISALISNAVTYADDTGRRPDVNFGGNIACGSEINRLSQFKNDVANKHKYNVQLNYDPTSGLIKTIVITDSTN